MTVTMTSEAFGKLPGQTYTGPEEDWLLAQGYAKKAGYADDVAAVLNGTTNAATIVTGGNLVLQVDQQDFTVALATNDTASAAATKIDTALTGAADAAIVSSKLKVTSVATGSDNTIKVISGTGTVLANLGLTAGQTAKGGDGGPGVSDTGPTDVLPAKDPTQPENREVPDHRYAADPDFDAGNLDAAIANLDADEEDQVGGYGSLSTKPKPPYDFDTGGVDDEPPVIESISPANGLAAGGTPVTIRGSGFERATGVTFGGSNGVSFQVVDDFEITVTTPPHAAGAVAVVVLDPVSNTTKANGFTYA